MLGLWQDGVKRDIAAKSNEKLETKIGSQWFYMTGNLVKEHKQPKRTSS